MSKFLPRIAVAAVALGLTSPALATFVVSIEAPTIETTTSQFSYVGTETFDSRTTGGGQTLTTNFSTSGANTLGGTYTDLQVNTADQYGGANGTGKYAVTFSAAGYSLALNSTGASGVNYFGFWLSALDGGNQVSFYKGSTLVYSFSPSDLLAAVNSTSAYKSNPNAAFAGQNPGEAYAFVNFYDQGDTFDKIVFQETPQGGGYESDNHTIGYYTAMSGTVISGTVSGVPEPATWASLIVGFGVIGAALRRGRKLLARPFR